MRFNQNAYDKLFPREEVKPTNVIPQEDIMTNKPEPTPEEKTEDTPTNEPNGGVE